ncbi:hypothetical protein MMC34_003199 [Xylographa carneopallida]|nr:hypothetical protein [Xylographa carneopallida]
MAPPTSVHLVGSVPFSSAEEVFTKSIQALPGRLHTIPDGETGPRHYFAMWQSFVFPPQVLGPFHRNGQLLASTDFECTLDDIKPTKYDEKAIESYQTFCKLRVQGLIPRGVRFQVSLPTPISVAAGHVDFAYRERVEPLYMERLIQDIRRLQDAIPAHDLAIQIDAPLEFAYLEYERGRLQDDIYKPYFCSVKEGILERISQLSTAVDHDVQLGYHLCYGDHFHKHFIEPEDTGLLVEIATGILQRVGSRHSVRWFHFPVPKDRSDEAYFAPLKGLDLGDTKLILGLVHPHDQEGTEKRLKAAQASYPLLFGVATECGMGRTPLMDVESIYTIARNVTSPA